MFIQKLKAIQILKEISVEPAVFFYYITGILLNLIGTNLYLQKACRDNITSEPDLSTPCDDEKRGVLFVSTIGSNYRFVEMMILISLVVLVTCWSDEGGVSRRYLIFSPTIGVILQSVSGCIQSYFWYWHPLIAALTDMTIQVLSGGFMAMIIGSQIYISQVSTHDNRTMRIGLLTALKFLSMPFANGTAGFLIRGIGFFNSYLVCVGLSFTTLICAVLLVKEIPVDVEKKVSFWSLFKLTRIIDSFKVVFKQSLGKKRRIVLLLLIVHAAVLFANEGERNVFYLFTRYKFKWDERMYSVYQAYKVIGLMIGAIISSVILSKILKIHDALIGSFAAFWDILAALGYIFANKLWHFYLIPSIDIFHGVSMSICYSFLSKFYETHEFGRVNAVFHMFSLFIPFCHPVYNFTFQKTLDIFPSAFFIISVVLYGIVWMLYSYTYYYSKKLTKVEEPMDASFSKSTEDINMKC